MIRLFCIVITIGLLSCGNNGNGNNQDDTITAISRDTGFDGSDTTGLNVRAAQPVDSNNRLREPMQDEPGSNKSGLDDDN